MTCSSLHRTSFAGLVLLQYHLFQHVITVTWFTNHFSDLSCVSDLDILSSYFISFIVWIADIGQVNVNVSLVIVACVFIHCFYNHHDYQILDYHD